MDANGLMPWDTGYDASSDPQAMSTEEQQSRSMTSGAPSPAPPAAGGNVFTPIPGKTKPAFTTPAGISGVDPAAGVATGTPDPKSALSVYLNQFPNDPARAVGLYNQNFPGNPLQPEYYADRKVIGVQGQQYPYLTAPGTTSGQTTWDWGGVPGGDKAAAGPANGGILDLWPGFKPPGEAPAPWQAPSPYPYFQAPTAADVRAGDPSYDFDLNQSIGALENSAAAKGTVRGGGTLEGIESMAGNFADQQFGNIYNRNLGTYVANKGTYDMNTANSRQQYLDSRQAYLDAAGIWGTNRDASLGQLDKLYGAGAATV